MQDLFVRASIQPLVAAVIGQLSDSLCRGMSLVRKERKLHLSADWMEKAMEAVDPLHNSPVDGTLMHLGGVHLRSPVLAPNKTGIDVESPRPCSSSRLDMISNTPS